MIAVKGNQKTKEKNQFPSGHPKLRRPTWKEAGIRTGVWTTGI